MGIEKLERILKQKNTQIDNLNTIMSNDNDLPSIAKEEITNQLEEHIKEKEELETIINAYNIVYNNMKLLKTLPKTEENREKYNSCVEEINKYRQFLSDELKQDILNNLSVEKRKTVEEEPVVEKETEEEVVETPVEEETKVETLEKTVLIKKIGTINKVLWSDVEGIRHKAMTEKEEIEEEKEEPEEAKSKGKRLNKNAFVSISTMATITTLVSFGIVLLGMMVSK